MKQNRKFRNKYTHIWIFEKGTKAIQWKKYSLSKNCADIRHSYANKKKIKEIQPIA